ncbi:DNA alkylation repair protein [Streptomyces atratus]|uniref:DNA alkylation repair protein n=1 Tax=Streptomyces atratus TaxID=1893 RepID=UPI0033C112F7
MSPAAEAAPGVPSSELTDTVPARLTILHPTAADPGRDASAAAHMKHVAPFLGIPTPQRRALSRTVLDATDTERLFGYCLRRADHPDSFVRKAIGWCLREYAKTDPRAVRDFVDSARDRLSPLSVREAMKHL